VTRAGRGGHQHSVPYNNQALLHLLTERAAPSCWKLELSKLLTEKTLKRKANFKKPGTFEKPN
jgi:hypothetical protein